MTKHILSPRIQPLRLEQDLTLIIGDMDLWKSQWRNCPASPQRRFISFDELTGELLATFKPDVILSPLFGTGFDALEVAQRLIILGYAGPYRAISDNLPRPDYICREIRAHAHGIDFDLVVIPEPMKVA